MGTFARVVLVALLVSGGAMLATVCGLALEWLIGETASTAVGCMLAVAWLAACGYLVLDPWTASGRGRADRE